MEGVIEPVMVHFDDLDAMGVVVAAIGPELRAASRPLRRAG